MIDSGVDWIGMIPRNWQTNKLKFVIEFINGFAFDSNSFSIDSEIPVIRQSDISKDLDLSHALKVPYNSNLESFKIKKNDIIIGMSGSIGKLCMVKNDDLAYINQRVGIIRGIYNSFLYYVLQTKGFEIHNSLLSFGTAVLNISAHSIGQFVIPFPSEPEQQRIATFLDRKCADIDNVLEKTKASIEEYKKLKQSIITEAVTKGISGEREMKDSGIPWIDQIPKTWQCYRITNLYEERAENGNPSLPILTVSINNGVSDYEIADEDCDRVFVRSEDRTKYKRVYPSDLAYNMMRAWQGAFGAVRVEGMVSPAYVVAKPKFDGMVDSRYIEALLRTPSAVEEMHRYSHGIADFRLRLYWPEFKNIKICVPPIEEQKEIADYIDKKASSIDSLISSKELFIMELETYRKSLIYEYVTGKKEVTA